MSRDAYVAWQGNRYLAPWTYASQQVRAREQSGVIEVYAGDSQIAVHARLLGQHRIAAQSIHHVGIPLGSMGSATKTQVRIRPLGPEVEVRSLTAYEFATTGGAQ